MWFHQPKMSIIPVMVQSRLIGVNLNQEMAYRHKAGGASPWAELAQLALRRLLAYLQAPMPAKQPFVVRHY